MSLKTTEDLQAMNEAARQTFDCVRDLAEERVRDCMMNSELASDSLVGLAARWMFEHQPLHQCYWNDRFCIAVMCNLLWYHKRLAAWCVVSNGINGYFEWKTHRGYNMEKVLQHLGFDLKGIAPLCSKPTDYHELDLDVCSALAKMFNLPTARFPGHKTVLTPEEQKEAQRFNEAYDFRTVL